MANTYRGKNPVRRSFRLLRSEFLERRELMAVAPLGGGLLAAAVQPAGPAYAEVSYEFIGQKVTPVNNMAELSQQRLQETTTGAKDPWTGQDLSKDANPGWGLPGGEDLSKEFPSGEQQWNDRLKGFLGGGSDWLGEGTPFDDKPGSNLADDFLKEHGVNIGDPLAAKGKGRSDFSPAEDDSGSSAIYCASDYQNLGKAEDDCIVIQYDGQGDFKTDTDRQMATDFVQLWFPDGSSDQQYEGEGGYTGGGGHSATDLYFGSTARLSGKVIGGRDPGEAGLGQDTGGKMPALFEDIGQYVAQGGRVYGGKAGYQSGDSGHGQDIGGTAENTISGLKNALDAQRFIIDPNAPNPEEIPWWMREKVSPMGQASAAQMNGVQAGLEQGVAAQQEGAAHTN